MKRFFETFLNEKGYLLFLSVITIYWLLNYVTNEFVLTDSLMYNSLYGQLPEQYIDSAIAFHRRWAWVSYAILPVILALKWLFISAFIATGSVFMGFNVRFRQIFKITMVCEWLFVTVGVINFIILLFSNAQSMEEIQGFNLVSTLSIGHLIQGVEGLQWLVAPLQSLNIFQLIFVIALALGVSVISNEKFGKSLTLVMKSYGAAFVIWIVLIAYISVSYA